MDPVRADILDPSSARNSSPSFSFNEAQQNDFQKSGLSQSVIDNHFRPSKEADKYIILYHKPNFKGQIADPLPIPQKEFHREKVLRKQSKTKYMQPPKVKNHIFFPQPSLLNSALVQNPHFLILCEGEKKALKLCQEGFPAIALGGKDNWRQKKYEHITDMILKSKLYLTSAEGKAIPKSEIKKIEKKITELEDELLYPSEYAEFFSSIPAFLESYNIPTLIVMPDVDNPKGYVNNRIKESVINSFSVLSCHLQAFGNIETRLCSLSPLPEFANLDKVGADDYLLLTRGKEVLQNQLSEGNIKKLRFPTFQSIPDLRRNREKLLASKKDLPSSVARRLDIAYLDSVGRRFASRGKLFFIHNDGTLHIFKDPKDWDYTKTLKLAKVDDVNSYYAKSLFPEFYSTSQDFHVAEPYNGNYSHNDANDPTHNSLFYKISEKQNLYIDYKGDSLKTSYVPNGYNNVILIDNGDPPAGNLNLLSKKISSDPLPKEPKDLFWSQHLLKSSVVPFEGLDFQKTVFYLVNLFTISPWLLGWKGLQLPIEIYAGEKRSGKTDLANVRGFAFSRTMSNDTAPTDERKLESNLLDSNGFLVFDNIQHLRYNKSKSNLIQSRLSNLVTSPDSSVKQYKLYANGEMYKARVHTTMAFTTIDQVFDQPDFLERCTVINMDPIPDSNLDTNFLQEFNKPGAWESIAAEQFILLGRFFKNVAHMWEDDFDINGGSRLRNFDQTMCIMAETIWPNRGYELMKQILPHLKSITAKEQNRANAPLQALKAFAVHYIRRPNIDPAQKVDPNQPFLAEAIKDWYDAFGEEEFRKEYDFQDHSKIRKLIKTQAASVEQISGIKQVGKTSNYPRYALSVEFIQKTQAELEEEDIVGGGNDN